MEYKLYRQSPHQMLVRPHPQYKGSRIQHVPIYKQKTNLNSNVHCVAAENIFSVSHDYVPVTVLALQKQFFFHEVLMTYRACDQTGTRATVVIVILPLAVKPRWAGPTVHAAHTPTNKQHGNKAADLFIQGYTSSNKAMQTLSVLDNPVAQCYCNCTSVYHCLATNPGSY